MSAPTGSKRSIDLDVLESNDPEHHVQPQFPSLLQQSTLHFDGLSNLDFLADLGSFPRQRAQAYGACLPLFGRAARRSHSSHCASPHAQHIIV